MIRYVTEFIGTFFLVLTVGLVVLLEPALGAVAIGSVGTPGTWRAFYMFQYVERDAVVGAYNTDDWWFHSRYRGHRAGVAVTLFPQVYVQGAFLVQRRLDLKTWLNRITVDLVKMF